MSLVTETGAHYYNHGVVLVQALITAMVLALIQFLFRYRYSPDTVLVWVLMAQVHALIKSFFRYCCKSDTSCVEY